MTCTSTLRQVECENEPDAIVGTYQQEISTHIQCIVILFFFNFDRAKCLFKKEMMSHLKLLGHFIQYSSHQSCMHVGTVRAQLLPAVSINFPFYSMSAFL